MIWGKEKSQKWTIKKTLTVNKTMSEDADNKVNTETVENADKGVRVLSYDFDDLDDLDDLDMEIDLSDIFDDWKSTPHDDEVLKLFRRGQTEDKKGSVSDRTMVADRASIKESVLEENSLEKQAEREAAESEEEYADNGKKKRRHRRSFFFLKVFFLLIVAGATIGFALSPFFTIKKIEVEGNKFYTDRQIINMSEVKTGGNLFLNAQKSTIRDNLKDNTYFRSVSVRRSIPDTLVIVVEEKQELAALTYGDKYVVIDDYSEVLRVAKIDPEVTVVTGLTIKKMDIGEELEVEETKALKNTMATLHTMRDGDLFFKRIELSEDSLTAYIYDMLKVRGTSEQLKAAIEDGSLAKVVNKLMKNKIKRGTIILGDNNYISFSPAV